MRSSQTMIVIACLFVSPVIAQGQAPAPQTVPNPPHETPAAVARYIKVPGSGRTLLHDVRVIDGTGAPAREHQDITLRNGKIQRIEPA